MAENQADWLSGIVEADATYVESIRKPTRMTRQHR